ncbi:MAG: aminoacetone oxidase family FAD-binding enzyme [Acidobacteria bacterium]|nr:aminoacetone oxidase family FAD-binding enzyme [Acidobacteriota bacterium]
MIVGAGAAGRVSALRAADIRRRAGASFPITVYEAFREAGRKILISGGGRCNILPMRAAPEVFVSESKPYIVRRFLEQFRLPAQRSFFEELLGGVLREERESAKLFPPTNRAKDVRDRLLERVAESGVEVRTVARIRDLARAADGSFRLRLDRSDVAARAVVVATGGFSVLPAGVDGAGLHWAAAFGHRVHPPYPALVPLVSASAPHAHLSGLSLTARLQARTVGAEAQSTGGFLFTHRGYSGPSVLNISHVLEKARLSGSAFRVTARFLSQGEGAVDWNTLLNPGPGQVSRLLERHFPDRLVSLLMQTASVEDVSLSQLTREKRRNLLLALEEFSLPVQATEGYRTAEVTGGGVSLEEIEPATGESRLSPGLFFAGEILDAFGPIGGFNFQWAWATGFSAGLGSAEYCLVPEMKLPPG